MDAAPDFTTPCGVRKIFVRGLSHTKHGVVQQELKDLEHCNSVQEICQTSATALAHLRDLGIFESVDVLVDSAPQDGPNGPLADVVIKVIEKKRLASATTGVSTQGGEGSMDAKMQVCNLFGWAERLSFDMELGQQKSNSFTFGVVRPRWLGSNAELYADVSKSAVSHIKHSSFVEKLLGGKVGARLGDAASPYGGHEVSCGVNLRDVCQLEKNTASWPILQQRGLSLKSALSHTYSLSRLDHPLVPEAGGALKLTTELAGAALPIGDAHFVKQTLHASAFVPLGALLMPSLLSRVSLGLSMQAGLLLPLGRDGFKGGESNVCDRFFCGGPGSLWGFRHRGVGPHAPRHSLTGEGSTGPRAPRDVLGGDVMAVGTARVSVALPGKLEQARVKAHAFVSAGGLQSISQLNADGGFGPSLRACAGVGLAMPTAVGRVELNLTHVLKAQAEDAVVRNGIQIGIMPGV